MFNHTRKPITYEPIHRDTGGIIVVSHQTLQYVYVAIGKDTRNLTKNSILPQGVVFAGLTEVGGAVTGSSEEIPTSSWKKSQRHALAFM